MNSISTESNRDAALLPLLLLLLLPPPPPPFTLPIAGRGAGIDPIARAR